ncbi:23S rRNA (uracil(1939)-C(5))-methyltransferase RlmD [Phocicoccus pinnipedialis]|uniref:Putative RNA methyltransferase n=1 Tax=Phocicoccus pinnipedialis TaxID=110845 RepID=A0A6V7R9G2_9BACL|nr:23S rRNA (uracil(1939)-C(5))-methyltransferase RlmD [Jeotgalicoccus pinnipedialis]MBP1940219.1 23S rRNA (uracil1939-C5)-methyltransferase [Jeotgalicoccus pinnipedialis]CAD2074079.1 putative RNA methyltransferase [Jeotgalicoccus pinnipedialis]
MNDILEGKVLNLTHESKGVVKVGHYPVFIQNSLPEEQIEFKITNEKKRFAEGELVRILKENENRVVAPCPYYSKCGGCQTQHMDDVLELEFKTESVRNTLSRHIKDIKVNNCVSHNLYDYRNKSVFHVREIAGEVHIGFYKEKSRDIVDVKYCMIQKPISNEIVNTVRNLVETYKVSAYNERTGRGYLRNVIVRSNSDNSEVQVVFVTNSDSELNKMFVEDLVQAHQNITSVIQNINTRRTNLVTGSVSRLIYGNECIADDMLGKTFKLRHQSFYQVNHEVTQLLYKEAIDQAKLTEDDIVIDAYCGVGTIGQIASPHVRKVIGIEVVEEAIRDAEENALLNEVTNAEYHVGKAEDIIKQLVKNNVQPDVVFIDPPRVGTDKAFLDAVLEVGPDRIVYISCNPATLGRDLSILNEQYEIEDVTPFNMFGKTYHVEVVCSMRKRDL